MRIVGWTCLLVTVLVISGLLFQSLHGTRVNVTNTGVLLNTDAFDVFEYPHVQIFVPRFIDSTPRFSGDIITGSLFVVIRPEAGLQLAEVDSGCGCAMIRSVHSEQAPSIGQPIELAFSVDTTGRLGPVAFPLTFTFRDRDGVSHQHQAQLVVILERAFEVPPVLEPVALDGESDRFARTLELHSKLPNIQWDLVKVIVTGGEAEVSLSPLEEKEIGVSVAEMNISGSVADVGRGGLTVVFESPQFREQPSMNIPFIRTQEHFVWKPERLEFRNQQPLAKLVIQANFECSVDELTIDMDSNQLTYRIKKVGRLFVVDFQLGDGEVPADNAGLSGMIRLIRNGEIAAEIPYVWSGT
ncbi:MAG: hypothetical protein Q8M16_17115 [Pirellulaceae bacterium]|nr:hypothetical protein [Pirellulaceae bacterium]